MPKNKLINDIELWLERWGATCVFNGETYKRYSFRYIKGRPRRGWRITIQKVSGVDETTLRVTANCRART